MLVGGARLSQQRLTIWDLKVRTVNQKSASHSLQIADYQISCLNTKSHNSHKELQGGGVSQAAARTEIGSMGQSGGVLCQVSVFCRIFHPKHQTRSPANTVRNSLINENIIKSILLGFKMSIYFARA